MSDPRADYDDPPPPEPGGDGGSTHMGPGERVQIVGWLGLLQAMVPPGVAFAYLGHPRQWEAGEAAAVLGMAGAMTALYLFAGGFLVFRGFRSRPLERDAVRLFNLLILLPFLVLAPLAFVGPFALIVFTWAVTGNVKPETWVNAAILFVMSIPLTVQVVRNWRVLWPAWRRWLDPTRETPPTGR